MTYSWTGFPPSETGDFHSSGTGGGHADVQRRLGDVLDLEESGVGVVAVGVGRGAFVKSLVGDAQFAAGQLLARAQRRSAVEENGIFAPLDVERRIATDGTPECCAGPPPDGRSVSAQQLDERRTVDV